MKRIPEPELMDAPAQARAYAEADFSEANGLFVDALLERFRPRPQSGRLIDLGCGPGDICLRLARALPEWSVLGVDAGPNMLKLAEQARQRLANDEMPGTGRVTAGVSFQPSYLPDDSLPAGHFQAVVSNSLLHHLPDPATLWQTIARIAAPGAWVQVMDLVRPDAPATARELVETYAADAPDILRRDFHNSLYAAWTTDEVAGQLDRAGLTSLELDRPSDRHWLASGFMPA